MTENNNQTETAQSDQRIAASKAKAETLAFVIFVVAAAIAFAILAFDVTGFTIFAAIVVAVAHGGFGLGAS